MCATGPLQQGGGSPPPPPPPPFSHLHYALCGLFGLGLLPWSQRPEGPSHLSSQLSPGPGHPGSTRSHRLWPACQVLARVPGPSEGTRPLSPTLPCLKLDGGGFPCPAWLLQAQGCWAALGCTPSPIADSTVKNKHSSPKLLLSGRARPGKGDLSLPQACKHRSHTRSRAPAANKSWPQGSLKEAAPGTDSRPGPRSLQGHVVASSRPPPLRPAPECRERKRAFNQH